jgi:hypothetical protein
VLNKDASRLLLIAITGVMFLFLIVSPLEAATLSVGSGAGSSGDSNIAIPVSLSATPAEEACGFNFDLKFDKTRLDYKSATIGEKAEQAGKSLSSSRPADDVVRILVIGFNQTVIENGVVVNFTFDIKSNAPGGTAALTLVDRDISNCAGDLLSSSVQNGAITVEGGPVSTTSSTGLTTSSTIRSSTTTTINGITSSTTSPPSSTTSSTNLTSTTTTSQSNLWPLLYENLWGEKKERNTFLLRTFRDEVLVNNEWGRKYIFLLYSNALEISLLLLQDDQLAEQLGEVTSEFAEALESLLYHRQMDISKDTMSRAVLLLDHFEVKSGPVVKSIITGLKEDMREGRIFNQLGMKVVVP